MSHQARVTTKHSVKGKCTHSSAAQRKNPHLVRTMPRYSTNKMCLSFGCTRSRPVISPYLQQQEVQQVWRSAIKARKCCKYYKSTAQSSAFPGRLRLTAAKKAPSIQAFPLNCHRLSWVSLHCPLIQFTRRRMEGIPQEPKITTI